MGLKGIGDCNQDNDNTKGNIIISCGILITLGHI